MVRASKTRTGPEPTIQDAAVLIPNVELAHKHSDIHQCGATRTAILAERLQANGAWVLLVVGSLIEAERVFTGAPVEAPARYPTGTA